MLLFRRRTGGWLTPVMNSLRNVCLNFRTPSLSTAATLSWIALRLAPRWFKKTNIHPHINSQSYYSFSFSLSLQHIRSAGTQPREGHRRDKENDGDIQREESSSFMNIWNIQLAYDSLILTPETEFRGSEKQNRNFWLHIFKMWAPLMIFMSVRVRCECVWEREWLYKG